MSDIIGISSEVEADVLEEKIFDILEKLACNIPSNCTKACHRVIAKSALLSFHKGTPASNLWLWKRICAKEKWKMLTYQVKANTFYK